MDDFDQFDLEPRPLREPPQYQNAQPQQQQQQWRQQQTQSPMYRPNFQASFDFDQNMNMNMNHAMNSSQQQRQPTPSSFQQTQFAQQQETQFPSAPNFQQISLSHQSLPGHDVQQQQQQQYGGDGGFQQSMGNAQMQSFQQQQQQFQNGFPPRMASMGHDLDQDEFMAPPDFGPQISSAASQASENSKSRRGANNSQFYPQDHPSHDFYNERQQRQYQQAPKRLTPVDPLPDKPAQYGRCISDPSISIINAATGGKPTPRRVEVMRSNDNTCHAYAIDKHTPPIDIINDGIRRGKIFRGVIYRRIAPLSNFFETPSREKALFVTIKRYNIEAMRDYLKEDSSPVAKENPDVEIERLQTLGDNVHIVGKYDKLMTDALVNDRYVYIIHPYTGHDTLTHRIARIHPNSEGDIDLPMPRILPDILETKARALFRQLLTSVHYMNATHGVCHCDLTTDNTHLKGSDEEDNEKLLLTEMSRSVRAPPATWNSNFMDAPPLRNFGGTTTDKSFWAPEVWMSRIQDADGHDTTWQYRGFSPPARDLWSAVLMLFRYVTGELLYELPDPVDPTYRYFVLSQGLSPTSPLHQELSEQWNDLQEDLAMDHAGAGFVMRRIDVLHHKLQLLSPELLELFDNAFRISPMERWNLMKVVQCRWMNMDVADSASVASGVSGTPMDQMSERSVHSHGTHTTHNTFVTHGTHMTHGSHATQTTYQPQQQTMRTYSIDPF